MQLEKLQKELIIFLNNFIKENDIDLHNDIDLNSRLLGSSSALDSMDLVTFIVEVEQFLDDNYGFQIQLATEKAMSRRSSPFVSIKSLSNYIIELYND